MSEQKSNPVPLCQDCMHVDKSAGNPMGNPRYWRCKRTTNPEYVELLPLVARNKMDVSPFGFCLTTRKYDLDDNCGPEGKWFEPAEVAP